MELRDVGRALRKRRLLFIGFVLLVLALAAAYALTKPKEYEATTTLVVTPVVGQDGPLVRPEEISTLLGTYSQVAKSRGIRARADTLAGRPIKGKVETSTEAGTGILRITGQAEDPDDALLVSDTVGRAFRDSLRRNQLVRAEIVEAPRRPTSAVQPRPVLIMSAALILALIGGVMLALLADRIWRRVATGEDVAELTPAPVIGHFPYERALRKSPNQLVWRTPEASGFQEALRALRTNVDVLLSSKGGRALLVTSSTPAQGKSMTVANLAIAFSQAGHKTIVIDGDFRNPRQHLLFGQPNYVGLTSLIMDSPWEPPESTGSERRVIGTPGASPRPNLRSLGLPLRTDFEDLLLIPAGPPDVRAIDALAFRFELILREVMAEDALVIVDSPPILAASDARVLASAVGQAVLVVNAQRERPAAMRDALRSLELTGTPVMGVVLNALTRDVEDTASYGYGYAPPPLAR
jgi:polysaccharide biosynthesis transport protein